MADVQEDLYGYFFGKTRNQEKDLADYLILAGTVIVGMLLIMAALTIQILVQLG